MGNKRPFSVFFNLIYQNNIHTSFGIFMLFASVQKALSYSINWNLCLLFACAIPPVYLADHWYDNVKNKIEKKAGFLFWIVLIGGILGSIYFYYLLEKPIQLRLMLPAAASFVYFVVFVFGWNRIKNEILRNILASIKNAFIATVFITVFVYTPEINNRAFIYLFPALFLVLFQNLLVYSFIDSEQDLKDKKANAFNLPFLKNYIKGIALACFLVAAFFASFSEIYSTTSPLFVLGLFIVSVIYLTIIFIGEAKNRNQIRFFADLLLALPALSLLFN